MKKIDKRKMEEGDNPLDVYLFLQSEVMASFAFSQGKIVPETVMKSLAAARRKLAGNQDAAEIFDTISMSRTHASLSALVSPARPGTLLLINRFKSQKYRARWLGPVPLLRRLIILSILLLAGLIVVSLSPKINYQDLEKGMFGHSGLELLLNLLLLLFSSGLGAAFSGLYTTINSVRNMQYDEIEAVSFFVRFTMGLITGLFISELIPIDMGGDDGGSSGAIGKVTLAVLGGFSAHILYGILSKMVESFQSMVGEGDDMIKEIGRLDSQIQKQMAAQAAERDRQKSVASPPMESTPTAVEVVGSDIESTSSPALPAVANPSLEVSSPKAPVLAADGWSIPPLLKAEDYFSQAHPSIAKGVESLPREKAFSAALAKYDRGGASDIYDESKVVARWKGASILQREINVYWLACKNTTDYISSRAGVRDTGSSQSIALLKQGSSDGTFTLLKDSGYEKALISLDKNLEQGYPVVVGVSYGVKAGRRPSGQSHFILVVGRGEDSKGKYYMHFDPGRANPEGCNTIKNRLYFNRDPQGNSHPYYISGMRGDGKKMYILCEVRQMVKIQNT